VVVVTVPGLGTFTGENGLFTWQAAPVNLFRMQGRKSEAFISNRANGQSTTWGRGERDAFFAAGGFVLSNEPDPAWWNVTEAQARALIGL
jgi:hypothetical protein